MSRIYDFSAETIDGKPAPLADYRDKVILIVNTASKCGFTGQYAGLEALYRKYRDRGLVVLGFPCNQFGAQEPGDEAEIANFCSLTYDVDFPMMRKIDVNGPKAHPLYAYLKQAKKANVAITLLNGKLLQIGVEINGIEQALAELGA